jgi:hypothetical protein
MNYIDTKAKCRHLKKLTCKETLRQVFIRVYKLEIHSVMLVFSIQLCELLPLYHRVGRVLSVSPVVGIGTPPTPLAAGECAPPPFGTGGGHTPLRLKGWGSPNSHEGTYTVVLYIYKYFVPSTLLSGSLSPPSLCELVLYMYDCQIQYSV